MEKEKATITSAEDKVMKVAMQAFGESIMKYLGQTDQVKRVAPTEHIHLEVKQLYEDFNYEMLGGYWRHYEFESDRITIADMRRFREYEAFLSMTHQVPVITTVLCSAAAKNLRSELTEGINTYKVETIGLKGKDSDEIFNQLEEKLAQNEPDQYGPDHFEPLQLDDLIPMLMTPLMSGSTSVYERLRMGFRILKRVQQQFHKQDIQKMYAILYTFSCKFLHTTELNKIKEEIGMTILGEMLMQDGVEKGLARGLAQGKEEGIKALIETCQDFGISFENITMRVADKFSLSSEKALEYVNAYYLTDTKQS